jgi:hypothetical protein
VFYDFSQVSRVIAIIHFSEKNTANASKGIGHVNLAESFLTSINEMGYPHHDTPELCPMLKLCYDLLNEKTHQGYFYNNDKKLLADIALRELNNIPVHVETTEVRYR